jgi:heme-degrading monooxygenase HmoA
MDTTARPTYICSATRLRVNRPGSLIPFLRASLSAGAVARRTPGNVSTRLLGMPPFPVFFTFTVWESPEAMHEFVKTEQHRVAMAGMAKWARHGKFVRFAATRRRPGWRQAFRALRKPDGVWTPEGQTRRSTTAP